MNVQLRSMELLRRIVEGRALPARIDAISDRLDRSITYHRQSDMLRARALLSLRRVMDRLAKPPGQ